MNEKMTYAGVGVDYEAMDPFKRLAQRAGRETAKNIMRFGFSEVGMSRGESAFLMDAGDHYVAHVEEGLGTKNLVAEIRQNTKTGRPCGGAGFIRRLEKLFGRRLGALPWGRPPKVK